MIYQRRSTPFTKLRLLISGLSQSGKTTSLPTFIYGQHDISSDDTTVQDAAIGYANHRQMVIIECPGETGHRSLLQDSDHLTSYYMENGVGEDTASAAYSKEALALFWSTVASVEKQGVAILAIDGAHGLYDHMFNKITEGEWLSGLDMNVTSDGRSDRYRSARFYNQAHRTFNQYLAHFYNSSIQTVIVTSWEEWQGAKNDTDKPAGIEAPRYLWPAFPGSMAIVAPGKFDARVSARLERRCLHNSCVDTISSHDHYCWQFLPRGDVAGVGVKGLRVTNSMTRTPYIHQQWPALQQLLAQYTQ